MNTIGLFQRQIRILEEVQGSIKAGRMNSRDANAIASANRGIVATVRCSLAMTKKSKPKRK